VPHEISIADARRVLSGDSRFQLLLKQLSGTSAAVGAFVPAVAQVASVIAVFEKTIPTVKELSRKVRNKSAGTGRRDRDEILTAAHATVVVAAYFEAFRASGEPARHFVLNYQDQVHAAGAARAETRGPLTAQLVNYLLSTKIPVPSPCDSYHDTIEKILSRYREMSNWLVRFLETLEPWDELSETERTRLLAALKKDVPEKAVSLYETHVRSLASDHLEFGLWLCLRELAAGDTAHREISRSLKEVLDLLQQVVIPGPDTDDVRSKLASAYKDVLSDPIVGGDGAAIHGDLNIPTIEEAYIDPAFRVATVFGAEQRPADEKWWENHTGVRQNLSGFLAGYLTGGDAADFPLVVLGHPGAGKSLMTKVLCARVPAAAFPPVRVELRRVNAKASVREQIEEALYEAIGERLGWDQVGRAAAEAQATPLILLDGFDELLQNTGVDQSDYLRRVREFQQTEARQKRPVAVVVTSRTTVAHQMRFPIGCPVVKLEGLDEPRINSWLTMWNRANADYFERHKLAQLDLPTVRDVRNLAEQPLLLLMLALYDADGNALRNSGDDLGQAALYEGLLQRFVRREIERDPKAAHYSEKDFNEKTSSRLELLALLAFAMFNRGAQSVRVRELRKDLSVLLGEPTEADASPSALDDADLVGGGFFLIHESRALVGSENATLRTYEFLHATFGEYLIARESFEMLHSVTDARTTPAPYGKSTAAERRLRALLSFAPLTSRQPIRGFLLQLADDEDRLAELQTTALELVKRSMTRASASELDRYTPAERDAPFQYACYSLNLILISLCLHPAGIALTDLFAKTEPEAAADNWRRTCQLWRAMLTPGEWDAAARNFKLLLKDADGDAVPVALTLRDGTAPATEWIPEAPRGEDDWRAPDEFDSLSLLADPSTDLLLGLLEPLRIAPIRMPWGRRASAVPRLPPSLATESNVRIIYELLADRPSKDPDAELRLGESLRHILSPLLEAQPQFYPIVARALAHQADRFSTEQLWEFVARILVNGHMSIFNNANRLSGAVACHLMDCLLVISDREGLVDSTVLSVRPLLEALNVLLSEILDHSEWQDRLAVTARLHAAGPVGELLLSRRSRSISGALPPIDIFAREAAQRPRHGAEIIRLAENYGCTEWLGDVAAPALATCPDNTLIWMTDDIFDILDRAVGRNGTLPEHSIESLRERRSVALATFTQSYNSKIAILPQL
jgi:hypothetical protein